MTDKSEFLKTCGKVKRHDVAAEIRKQKLTWLTGKPAAADGDFAALTLSERVTVMFHKDALVEAQENDDVWRVGLDPEADLLVVSRSVLSPAQTGCGCPPPAGPRRTPLPRRSGPFGPWTPQGCVDAAHAGWVARSELCKAHPLGSPLRAACEREAAAEWELELELCRALEELMP